MSRVENIKLTIKKKTLYDSERETPRVQSLRESYSKRAVNFLMRRAKFIDESGINLGFTRLRGRAEPGKRVVEGIPSHSGEQLTLIAAIAMKGINAEWILEGAMDRAAFEVYIKQVLLPTLRKGDIVIMDNLQAHKGKWVEELLNSRGVRLEYLPPYSPDLNPIELCWSKLKSILRSLKPRSVDALLKAVKKAFRDISLADIKAWFSHCGYAVQ